MMRYLLFAFLGLSGMAFANDGFYQGAGNTLYPVSNAKLRVVKEELSITPIEKPICYDLFFEKKAMAALNKKTPPGSLGELKPLSKCRPAKNRRDVFIARHHVVAKYEIEVLEAVENVQMGFPISAWNFEYETDDGLDYLPFPGAVNFSFIQDDAAIAVKDIRWVVLKQNGNEKVPAFIWHTSFPEKKRLTLISEYDFGDNYSATFFDSLLPKGSVVWWDERSVVEKQYGESYLGAARRIYYYLSPLAQWAKPAPKTISVKISRSREIPITQYLPNSDGLKCIDSQALYFQWSHELPTKELDVSFPERRPKLSKFKTHAQLKAWKDLLDKSAGKKVAISCELVNSFVGDLKKSPFVSPCVPKCD